MHDLTELTESLQIAMATQWNALRDRAHHEEEVLRKIGAALGQHLPELPALSEGEAQRVDAMVLHGPAQSVARTLCLLTITPWKPVDGPHGPITLELPKSTLQRLWAVRELPDGTLQPAADFSARFDALIGRIGLRGEVSAERLLLAAIDRALSCAESAGIVFEYSVDDGAFGTVRNIHVVLREGEAKYRIGDGRARTNPTGRPVEGRLIPRDDGSRRPPSPFTQPPRGEESDPEAGAGEASPRRGV